MAEMKMDEFAFVLLAGLVMIILFIVVWPPTGEKGNVTVSEGDRIVKLIDGRDAKVEYAFGLEVLAEKNDQEVAEPFIGKSRPLNLIATISEDKLRKNVTDAFIRIVVEDTNKLKPLVVTVNEKEVYRDYPTPGELLISVNPSLLKTNNIITIKTESPGWLQFWKTSYYKLALVKFGINYFGVAYKEFTFDVEDAWIKNFKYGRLEFVVENMEGRAPLIVKLNDKVIYRETPKLGRVEREFRETGLTAGYVFFKVGTNVLTLSTEPTATYNIKNILLSLIYKA
jgi:hypothetical protein